MRRQPGPEQIKGDGRDAECGLVNPSAGLPQKERNALEFFDVSVLFYTSPVEVG